MDHHLAEAIKPLAVVWTADLLTCGVRAPLLETGWRVRAELLRLLADQVQPTLGSPLLRPEQQPRQIPAGLGRLEVLRHFAFAEKQVVKNGSPEIRTQDQSVKSPLNVAEIPCYD